MYPDITPHLMQCLRQITKAEKQGLCLVPTNKCHVTSPSPLQQAVLV